MKASRSLANRFLRGEESAANELYELYRRPVCFHMSSYLPSVEDLKDAYQEVFLKLLSNRESILSPDALESYLYRIATSVAIDMAKANNKDHEDDVEEISDSPKTALDDLLPYDLPETEKKLLAYRLVLEMPWKEICSLMDLPVSTAKLKYRLALDKVKEELSR